MKKLGITLFILIFFFAGSSLLWAGGADNKTNWSAEYIGILNRNAAIDAADIVMYNPAGVMEMENGLTANLSAHYIAKDYNNEINGVDFDQDEPSVVPGLYTVYKKEKWAAFLGVTNVLGGGVVDFEHGNATTNLVGVQLIGGANALLGAAGVPSTFWYNGISSQWLEAEHTGLALTTGAAFEVTDTLSVSLGLRYMKSEREMEGDVTIAAANPFPAPGVNDPTTASVAFEEEATGFGGVVGINWRPNDRVNVGIHYDSEIELDYDQTVVRDTHGILPALGISQGGERNRNLPAVLAGGVSYWINDSLRMETNLTYYLNNAANLKDIPGTPRDESALDNGFDVGIGFEYKISDALSATCGYLYTETGVDAVNMTPELPELDAHSIGAGLTWQFNDRLTLTCGLGHVFYIDDSYLSAATGATINYEKDITFVAFGAEYKFF
ncbi:MAG: hypothetical protein D3926_20435 [Desulfobacteraceae bacterium]|nr:MAG: hypothetical protein D3926_20435 [Desulfobacteraceae bacterium]